MAYKALYRKYRPSTFSEVVGQEHITQTLKNELSENKIVHAYLFTGTRGTGKTSCAKILAKAVNCLSPINGDPCGECEMCRLISNDEITDICEIDAASNNGVDSIRELREQVNYAPAAAKYRVYIIDEVHMLSQGAFNALLKTLEEPPEHVIFILATTEVHKLPATILSRCQRFDFSRIDPEKICERLMFIAEKEGFSLTKEAGFLIADAADGGMRDAVSLLDLCASNCKVITEETVSNVCAMAGSDYLLRLSDFIKAKDTESALKIIDELHNSSVDMLRLSSELTEHFRNLMICKIIKGVNKPIVCSKKRLDLLEDQAQKFSLQEIMSALDILQSCAADMQSGNRRVEMEMIVIKLCKPEIFGDIKALELRVSRLESGIKPEVMSAQITEAPKAEEETSPAHIEEEKTSLKAGGEPEKAESWEDVIAILQKSCPLIAGVLKDSNAYIENDYLLIETENSQFKTLVNGSNALYRNAIRNAAKEVYNKTFRLGPYKKAQSEEKSVDPLLELQKKLEKLENK